MLFEKIIYPDDFPIHITIANIRDYPIHYHQDIEFVFVLKGSVNLKNGYCSYTLHEGDIFTNSGHEVHSITACDEDNIVALIQISTRYFSQYFPNLSKSCYRTYTNKPKTKKHDNLQEYLLNILLQYSIKSTRYKTACTYAMIDVIKYLEKLFNLFAFDGNVVVNFESTNQETIQRLSHIIGYIYQHYAEKITLDDLAEMEHLSTFYLSHMIKDCTGMNFREFLCFARVEWSEIQLLDSNKKISHIARDVGFSTTAYYEKYFQKWFGHSPQEHRKQYLPMVRSEIHREVISPIPPNKAIVLIRYMMSALNAQSSSTSSVNTLTLDIDVDIDGQPLHHVAHRLWVSVTCADFQTLGFNLFYQLSQLHPAKVLLLAEPEDAAGEQLHALLMQSGFSVEVLSPKKKTAPFLVHSAGNDSVALPISLMQKHLAGKDEEIYLALRDQQHPGELLSGLPSALTGCGIRKPGYFAYQMLAAIRGELLCWGKQYCVISGKENGVPVYMVIASNANEEIYQMCERETTAHQAKTILNEFKDEINFNVTLNLPPGVYSVMKYSITRNHNLFAYLSAFDFSDDLQWIHTSTPPMPTDPDLEIYTEDVRTAFNINFTMKGVGLQLAVIRLKGDASTSLDK